MSKFSAKWCKLIFEDLFNEWNEEKNAGGSRESCIHGSDIIKPEIMEEGSKWDGRYCARECVLKHYYEPNKGGQKNSSYLNKVFLNGWVLHEKWQALYEKYLEVIAVEKTVWHDKYKVAFTPDAILKLFGREIIVEIKGWKQEVYEPLNEDDPPPESPYKQAMLYCFLMEILHAIIKIENKNNQAFKVWHVEYDEEAIRPIIDRLNALKVWLDNWVDNHNLLPAKICQKRTEERAKDCPMSKVCFMDDKNRENYLKPRYKQIHEE